MISLRIDMSNFVGEKHTRLSAVFGTAPMAYMSLKEFAAAICPNQYGSSTTGVKKSTV